MKAYQIYSVLSQGSLVELQEFLSACPTPLDLPNMVLELGTVQAWGPKSQTPALNEGASYQVRPFRFWLTYNPRTNHHALVWELGEADEGYVARCAELGSGLAPILEGGPSIWLAEGGPAVNRHRKAWFNSKEDFIQRGINTGLNLTLTFEGEFVREVHIEASAFRLR